MPLIPKNYSTYKMLTLEIFVECEQKEVEPLRKALYDFYNLLVGTNEPGSPTLIEYQNYLTIAHLSNLKFVYETKPAAQPLHQKITVALLRYCEFIRLDKLFYEAGMSCQKNVKHYLFRTSTGWPQFYSIVTWTSTRSFKILTTTTCPKMINFQFRISPLPTT